VTIRAYRRPARVFAVLALTAPLAGTLVGLTAVPAFASQSSSVSLSGANDGEVIASPGDARDVTVTGTITNTGSTTSGGTLVLDGPTDASGSAFHSSTGISGCTVGVLASSCSKSASAKFLATQMTTRANGHWTGTVNGSATKGFYTNFKPTADPANLAAAANGRTEVDLSWSYSGTEPDKAGFEIVETHNGASQTLPRVPTSACSGSSCGYAITYPQPAVGTTESYSYTVTALRTSGGCGSCGDYTRSAASSSASAQLVGPPPPPSPTPTPSPTGGTTGGTTGSGSSGGTTGSGSGGTTGSGTSGGTSGGTSSGSTGSHSGGTSGSTGATRPIVVPTLPPLVASRRAFALGFNKFSPSLGIPKLPPLPTVTFPVTAPGSDTYQPTLPYANQTKKTTNVLSSPIAEITSGIDTEQLMKLLAIGLVLLAGAAHVRVFLSRPVDE
jgi:hypothetical protein